MKRLLATLLLLSALAWGQTGAAGGGAAGGTISVSSVAQVFLSATSLNLGNVNVGSSANGNIYYVNVGGSTLTVTSVGTITGPQASEFTLATSPATNCGGSLTAGQPCTITVTFTPAGAGTRSAQFTIQDSASGSPRTIQLSGTGVSACQPLASVSPTSLSFGNQTVGSSSAAQNLSYRNIGDCPLAFTSISVTGSNAGDFAVSTTGCTSPLAAGTGCTLPVTFTPTATGSRTAAVTIVDSTGTTSIPLSGTGVAQAQPSTNLQPAVSNSWMRLYVTQAYLGSGTGQEASAAELTAYDNTGAPLGKTGWSASADSVNSGNPASAAFDGSASTFWLSNTNPVASLPHWVAAAMGNFSTSFTAATANNTAACTTQAYCTAAFTGLSGNAGDTGAETTTPDPAPGNVSTVDVHQLLPTGTKVLAEMQGWFVTTPGVDHDQTHYVSSDSRYVAAATNQMVAEHLDGIVLDWYGQGTTGDSTLQQLKSNLGARCKSPQNCPVEFAAMIDEGYAKNQCSGATSGACVVTAVENALCYLNGQYFGNNAYLKQNPAGFAWQTSTDPVVYTFPPSGGWNTSDWTTIANYANTSGWASKCPAGQQGNNGPVLLVTENSAGFSAPWNGGFAWPQPLAWSSTNQYLYDGSGSNYLENFYTAANSTHLATGSAYKGFDDNNASWGSNRVIAQQCGQVLLNTLAKSPSTLVNLMLATWDDYEEGTELETGIDNCWRVSAPSFSGNTINWSLTKTDATYAAASTIDHFTIWYTDASGDLGIAADNVSSAATSYDLSTSKVPANEAYTFYVQAVGAPFMQNQMSAGTTATLSASGGSELLSGVALTVRQDGCDNGWPQSAEVDTSPDGSAWTAAWSGSVSYPAGTTFTCPGASQPLPLFLPLTPGGLSFGNQQTGTTSTAQTVILTNTGNAVLNLTLPATVTGDFAQASTTCTASLGPGASCTFSLTFTPTATGLRTGTLSIADNAANGSPQVVALWGYGVAASQAIAFVQAACGNFETKTPNNCTSETAGAQVYASYGAAQQAGDLNVAIISWYGTATINSVSDTSHNSYQLAISSGNSNSGEFQALYYASSIAAATAGANRLTVTFSAAPSAPDLRVLEYTGIAASPIDQAGATSGGGGTTSGSINSSTNNDLLVAGVGTATAISAPDPNWTQRLFVQAMGEDAEDRFPVGSGTFTLSATLNPSGYWVQNMAAFKGASSSPPPTNEPLSVTVSGPGQVDSSPSGITACTATCNASFVTGTVVTLTESSGSFLKWGGDCAGTQATCILTMNAAHSVSATFAYTVAKQQATTTTFYAGTLWNQPLPADVMSHLNANSDNIVKNVFHNSDSLQNTAYTQDVLNIVVNGTTLSTSSMGNGFYYADQSDPVYQLTGTFNCPKGPNATTANCPSSKYFHLVPGACFDSAPVSTSDDQELTVWDQSLDIDSTPGGRILFTYHFGTGQRCIPSTGCSCATTACAATTPACQLGSTVVDNFAGINFPGADTQAWGDGVSSDGGAAGATLLREQEIMQGTIKHALGLDTACLAAGGSPVFPATGDALHCSTDTVRPNNGALFFIDSAYNCDAQSGGAYILSNWQRPVCHAMQTYGGYVHATAGGTTSQLYVKPIEGGLNFYLLNLVDPFWNSWLMANAGPLTLSSGLYTGGPVIGGYPASKFVPMGTSTTAAEKALLWFMQMPGLITGDASNGFKPHLHIADPCIAVGLAKLSSYTYPNGTTVNACN